MQIVGHGGIGAGDHIVYQFFFAGNKRRVLIGGIEQALQEYKRDHGAFPPVASPDEDSTLDLYGALFGDSDGDGQSNPGETVYLSILDPNLARNKLNVDQSGGAYVIVDAWTVPLRYQSPGSMNPDFDLWSMGPDGEGGPDEAREKQQDDIKNW